MAEWLESLFDSGTAESFCYKSQRPCLNHGWDESIGQWSVHESSKHYPIPSSSWTIRSTAVLMRTFSWPIFSDSFSEICWAPPFIKKIISITEDVPSNSVELWFSFLVHSQAQLKLIAWILHLLEHTSKQIMHSTVLVHIRILFE